MAKRTTTRSRKSNGNGNGGTVSKAEAVRQYKADHPDAGPKEIAEALGKKGIEVSAGRVSVPAEDGWM